MAKKSVTNATKKNPGYNHKAVLEHTNKIKTSAKRSAKKPCQLIYSFDTKEEFKHAANGNKYFCTLWDIDQELRKLTKYGTEEESQWSEKAREFLHRVLNENDVEIY